MIQIKNPALLCGVFYLHVKIALLILWVLTVIHKEIVIVGGGPIGLTTALILLQKGFQVTVLDSGKSKVNDGRVLALSYASVEFLKEHDVWGAEFATIINEVHVSHKGLGVTRVVAHDLELETLGCTIKYADMCKVLENKIMGSERFEFITAAVDEVAHSKNYATITYRHDNAIDYVTADLVIMAEGGNVKLLDVLHDFYDYEQTAVVATIATSVKQNGVAYERFGNDGGLVLLPYQNNYVLVWSLNNAIVENTRFNKSLVQEKLQALPFMERFGNFTIKDEVYQFPLKLRFTKKRVLDNVVLIGNSAQTVHPVSAQGMNIGLRDAKILSDVILNAKDYRTNIFCLDKLKEYDKLRGCDALLAVGFTHYLAEFVDLDMPIINHIRGAGIIALSNCKILQNKVANSLIFGN